MNRCASSSTLEHYCYLAGLGAFDFRVLCDRYAPAHEQLYAPRRDSATTIVCDYAADIGELLFTLLDEQTATCAWHEAQGYHRARDGGAPVLYCNTYGCTFTSVQARKFLRAAWRMRAEADAACPVPRCAAW